MLLVAVLGLAWVAGARQDAAPRRGEATSAEAETTSAESAALECDAPSVCSAPAAATAAAVVGQRFFDRRKVEWVARKTRLGSARELFGDSLYDLVPLEPRSDDKVVWLVAMRPQPDLSSPQPGAADGGESAANGLLVVVDASDGLASGAAELGQPGESGIHYSDILALEEQAGLPILASTPTPVPTPPEACGPFVLCTPTGVLAVAERIGNRQIQFGDGSKPLNFDRAVARLVPWGLVETALADTWYAEEYMWCGETRADQLLWVVAVEMPFAIEPGDDTGVVMLLSPASNDQMLWTGSLIADPVHGLTMESVIAWASEPMPADIDRAVVPGDCQ